MESWLYLKLLSLVVLGGKWLPFSQVGGIPTSAKEPHWWCINGVPNNVTRKQLPQTKCFTLFLVRASAPIMNDRIWSFNSWPVKFMSMAAKSSDLVDKMSEANLQADGQVEKPAQGVADLREMEEEDSFPLHLPMWFPIQRPPLGCLNTKHCFEIQVTLTEELGNMPPPSHSWMAPLVEDMLWEARAGLTEPVVTSPGRAVLFYGRHSMGEGLKADEARDAAFLLTGAGTWIGKVAYLTADPVTIQEGRRAIAQTVSDNRVKARGLGCPQVNLPAQQPFKFNTQRTSPPKDVSRDYGSDNQWTPQLPSQGWGHNKKWRDQWPQSPRFPSPSLDHGFESDRSSLSMASSMSSQSDHSDGSRCSRQGRRHWEETHMKINLPIFKDDQTLLPYTIRS